LSDVCRERERKRSDSNHFHAKSPYGCEPRHNRRGRTTVMYRSKAEEVSASLP
jgi:hypothetical protein